MILADPYQTSIGKLVSNEKLIKELQKYIVATKNYNLNYEYLPPKGRDDIQLVFITGCDEDEKELPVWNYPIVFENLKKNPVVAVDLRKFVKNDKGQPLKLHDVMRDQGASNFLINTALIISDFIAEHVGDYRNSFSSIAGSYGMFVSYLVNSIVALNPVEHLDVELAAAYFANLMLTPGNEYKEYRDSIIARMSNSKFTLPVTKRSVTATLERVADYDDLTLTNLVNTIKDVMSEEKRGLITEQLLINMTANMWYGNGTNDVLVYAFECMPLWIALSYTALGDKTYKRARLSTILDKFNKQIGVKDYVKNMDLLLKEKMMELK